MNPAYPLAGFSFRAGYVAGRTHFLYALFRGAVETSSSSRPQGRAARPSRLFLGGRRGDSARLEEWLRGEGL